MITAPDPIRADAAYLHHRHLARERRRFERTVLPHREMLRGYAASLTRDPEAAEDVTQEALVRAWRHFPALRHADQPAAVATWLRTVARRLVQNRARDRAARARLLTGRPDARPHEADPRSLEDLRAPGGGEAAPRFETPGRAPGPEAVLLAREEAAALGAALAALRPEYGRALRLWADEGLTYDEIAAALGTARGTVSSRIARARRDLAAALARTTRRENGQR